MLVILPLRFSSLSLDFPGGSVVKNLPANTGDTSNKETQCRRHRRCGFDPWVRKTPWRRNWQPTPLSLPGKFRGQRSLAGYVRGVTESDATEHTHSVNGKKALFELDSKPS